MLVVHQGTPLPDELLPHQSVVLELADPDEPDQNWIVQRGPATDNQQIFGQLSPELPEMRFEYDPDDAEIVDVVAPVMDDSWILRIGFRREGDDVVPVRIDLRPRPGVQDVNARILRTLGFGAVRKTAVNILLYRPEVAKHFGGRWGQPVRHPGSAGRQDHYYAEWAQRYVAALSRNRRRPVKVILDEAAERGEILNRTDVANRLSEARRRGLLTQALVGRAGGELTTKAIELLGLEGAEHGVA